MAFLDRRATAAMEKFVSRCQRQWLGLQSFPVFLEQLVSGHLWTPCQEEHQTEILLADFVEDMDMDTGTDRGNQGSQGSRHQDIPDIAERGLEMAEMKRHRCFLRTCHLHDAAHPVVRSLGRMDNSLGPNHPTVLVANNQRQQQEARTAADLEGNHTLAAEMVANWLQKRRATLHHQELSGQ